MKKEQKQEWDANTLCIPYMGRGVNIHCHRVFISSSPFFVSIGRHFSRGNPCYQLVTMVTANYVINHAHVNWNAFGFCLFSTDGNRPTTRTRPLEVCLSISSRVRQAQRLRSVLAKLNQLLQKRSRESAPCGVLCSAC